MAANWFATEKNSMPKRELETSSNASAKLKTKRMPSFLQAHLPPALPQVEEDKFNPSHYFIQGWTGESLNSKSTSVFVKILNKIQGEVKASLFKSNVQMTRKFKRLVFDEFLDYAQMKELNEIDLNDPQVFWDEIRNKTGPHYKSFQLFFEYYSLKVAFIYLAKLRFIKGVCSKLRTEFNQRVVIYPNSFLVGVFAKGSRYELNSKATQANAFSWYTPSLDLAQFIIKNEDIFDQVSVSELIKNYDIKADRYLEMNTYSHSLSHKNYGLFLNLLMINLPIWLNNRNSKLDQGVSKLSRESLDLIAVKFSGDNLFSHSHSHWLAQENNKHFRWDQVLCSHFEEEKQNECSFSKISNELIFLSFLLKISEHYHEDFREFITSVINGYQSGLKSSNHYQESLFPMEAGNETYNRIVLNLNSFPKNNAQHYLINRISSQYGNLKAGGTLFAVSNKKLFVPSQKDKVKSLLQKFKVQAIIQLDELKGKGEVGQYIYVLTKRAAGEQKIDKESTPVFRVTGDLASFQEFQHVIALFEDFFEKHFFDTPAMYQNTNDQAITLEYFIEAIADGQLIHSSSRDNSKVTHPQYFQKLLKSCYSLSYFFDLENINFEYQVNNNDEFNLMLSDNYYTSAPLVLIVDRRTKIKTKLEIIPTSALEAKAFEYGRSLCHYYGLTPKWPGLSIDSIIDYFNSPVGEQIIDLTFNDNQKKIKSTVSKVLIPNAYLMQSEVPLHLASALELFKLSSKDLLNMIPSHIEKRFDQSIPFIGEMLEKHPGVILNLLSGFKRQVESALQSFEMNHFKDHSVNFNNPMIKSPLLMSKTYPIIPENDEIYIEFEGQSQLSSLHAGLQKTKIVQNPENPELLSLEIFSTNGKVLSMHSHKYLIYFVDFILSNAVSAPINMILKGVKVPSLNDLQRIIHSYKSLKNTLEDISKQIPTVQNQFINKAILNG
jgi:hypothetical protein